MGVVAVPTGTRRILRSKVEPPLPESPIPVSLCRLAGWKLLAFCRSCTILACAFLAATEHLAHTLTGLKKPELTNGMRAEEHASQKTFPQRRQWWRRSMSENEAWQL